MNNNFDRFLGVAVLLLFSSGKIHKHNIQNSIDNGGCVTYYNNITTHISYYNDYAEECK